MYTEHSKIRQFLVKTPFYHFLLRLRSLFEFRTVSTFGKLPDKMKRNTAYCISPYKTGTTYLTGLFKNTCRASHEPLQYTTLLHIDDTDFLGKRANYLNLDIECSGFFADRLTQLRKFAPNAPVLFLSRSPEAWIGSVINYFTKLGNRVSYNYIARFIFDPICGARIEDFYALPMAKKSLMVNGLLNYWLRVYTSAQKDPKVLIVPLEQIDDHLTQIENFFGHKAKAGNEIWKRENKNKKPVFLSDYVDLSPYKEDIRKFGYL